MHERYVSKVTEKVLTQNRMKRKCKNVDITNLDFIKSCIVKCLKNKKSNRSDIKRLFEQYPTIDLLALQLQKEIINRELVLVQIDYHSKYDNGSRKWRNIGIQDIKQQMYDYIAVDGLDELLQRIGKYQCASIKERGQIYCATAIFNHLQHDDIKYACKFDVKKYYESINQDAIITWLQKRVANDTLMWLITTLIHTFEHGLSIGSYLSQHLGNLYLSDIYHSIYEDMIKVRHHKDGTTSQVHLVKWCCTYMDDILTLGSNSRDMLKASALIIQRANDKGLQIKDTWRCFNVEEECIDMCGYKIYKTHITIRKSTFKKIRRAFTRFEQDDTNVALARRVVSYYGILKHSDSYEWCTERNYFAIVRKARKVISNESKI